MQLKNVNILMKPLIKSGQDWQNIDINGIEKKPKYYFSSVQWSILLISILINFKLQYGISKDLLGYIISAFSISVSLFMSLLVSIFDKFQNTSFEILQKTDDEISRLKQKKNFFKRFISITSYLVVLSILIIILCSFSYIFNLHLRELSISALKFQLIEIDIKLTIKCFLLLLYRTLLFYFIINYLYLTFFITGSAFEYYMSEMNSRKIIS